MKADNDIKVMVDYTVPPALANIYIANIHKLAASVPPQELAHTIAATVASCAFMMLSANDKQTVKDVFNNLIDDAARHFDHRKKLMEAKKDD